ncbi:hypothetical protein J2Z62_000281 [Mycoplasmoides fastidiosum]|uniref:Uncharacterized protein n=1 Tax=Mycoplasmoides fastidiosum TaxID=92758 RepID=A0ABU0LYS7_9BACT|nr:hypothetical protein [Mycoplasmoides fastidiosum]MDQ0513843.1 hypothetical protein [Mycoplasmoides fastidiosum]UUD37742.1 hypothetical protein NPA10_04205 [Mycoplasmoides fastidiosum]
MIKISKSEIDALFKMNYLQACKYLQEKYGLATGSYFANSGCKSTNSKIKRTKEGLYIHHIKENEFADLAQKHIAILCDFSYQEPINLVYCNLIEHLILHVLIAWEYMQNRPNLGIIWIIAQINDYFNENVTFEKTPHHEVQRQLYKDFKEEYFYTLSQIIKKDKENIIWSFSKRIFMSYKILGENEQLIKEGKIIKIWADYLDQNYYQELKEYLIKTDAFDEYSYYQISTKNDFQYSEYIGILMGRH